jgi:hypothetical protein
MSGLSPSAAGILNSTAAFSMVAASIVPCQTTRTLRWMRRCQLHDGKNLGPKPGSQHTGLPTARRRSGRGQGF